MNTKTEIRSEEKDVYRSSRLYVIIEAALEYFVALLTGGAFLAKVSTSIGISDSLTGIISSFVSLGCAVQLFSLFMGGIKRVKRLVIPVTLFTQMFFCLIYVIPIVPIPSQLKPIAFVACVLTANILLQLVGSPKLNWFMSLVDDKKRGVFTANKEIVSLIGGMIFSTVMGNTVDRYEAAGNISGAFILCGVTIFALMILQSVTIILTREKPVVTAEKHTNPFANIKTLAKNRFYLMAVGVSALWSITNGCSVPFYGTYQIRELGFSLTFVAILGIVYAIVRALVSRFWGSFADKHSFARMMCFCIAIAGAGYLINVFTTPSNGKIFYTAYYVLTAISMAGINSALTNLVLDYAPYALRTEALALSRTVYGLAGFFTTLAVSPLVTYIQNNGNRFLNLPLYAQQVVSAMAVLFCSVLVCFLWFGIMKRAPKKN